MNEEIRRVVSVVNCIAITLGNIITINENHREFFDNEEYGDRGLKDYIRMVLGDDYMPFVALALNHIANSEYYTIVYSTDVEIFYHGENVIRTQIRGVQRWYRNRGLHRDADLPAVVYPNNFMIWYQNGLIHRENNKPAMIYYDKVQAWFNRGALFKGNNFPSVIYESGASEYYEDDILYRRETRNGNRGNLNGYVSFRDRGEYQYVIDVSGVSIEDYEFYI